MSRFISAKSDYSNGNENTLFKVKAGEDVNKNDLLVSLGGYAYKAINIDSLKGVLFGEPSFPTVDLDDYIWNMAVNEIGDTYVLTYKQSPSVFNIHKISPGGNVLAVNTISTTSVSASASLIGVLSNGNIVVTMRIGTSHYYTILSESLGTLVSNTAITTGSSPGYESLLALKNGGFAITWSDRVSRDLKMTIISNDGVEVLPPTVIYSFSAPTYSSAFIEELSNGNIIVAADSSAASDYGVYMMIISPTGQVVVPAVKLTRPTSTANSPFVAVANGFFCVKEKYSAKFFDNQGNELPFSEDYSYRANIAPTGNNLLYVYYKGGAVIIKEYTINGVARTYGDISPPTTNHSIITTITNDYYMLLNRNDNFYVFNIDGFYFEKVAVPIDNTTESTDGDMYHYSVGAMTQIASRTTIRRLNYATSTVLGVAASSSLKGEFVNCATGKGIYSVNKVNGGAGAFSPPTGKAGNSGVATQYGVTLKGLDIG